MAAGNRPCRIATQARVEENLAQEGLSRHDLGREVFRKGMGMEE